ncbi:type 1 glutamine amidotransferase domain-containing protein [Pseudoalteromonas rubra]|uniref:Type 1 glutamine amidotransferase domain-containing protein n=1 Tax=Pseudoalteromonas rubra TaxID=43658 RepID=A0A5S3WHR2_9GAMM|nr:type 1 glutamine amidotransferase domain-containing protein [Pseudoalteromonas rubra]TMP25645.1 type 1 glutamine amidotransferase domain-containing protein [Pseudoalteromonas rubra]TMP27826.1 type 1 glutamine amidotransferase domain-containing protein [Pseudoalteromonas rubra]
MMYRFHRAHFQVLVKMLVLFALIMTFSMPALSADARKGKILFVISGDKHGFWLPEVVGPYRVLYDAGFEIELVSSTGKPGYPRGRLAEAQRRWLDNSPLKQQLSEPNDLETRDSRDYLAVYYAGGAGPMFDLTAHATAKKLTEAIYKAGGIIAADCHGTVALLNLQDESGHRLILNKRITGKANSEEGWFARTHYPFLIEDEATRLGAIFVAAKKGQVNVVVDGQFVTGQNPVSAIPMAEALLVALKR